MTETDVGRFPNIINKKKLTPLPLFRQNLSPTRSFGQSLRPLIGFGLNNKSAGFLPSTTTASTQKKFLSELKTVNNYGRLCDQPFLEYSSFHLQQVFGAGSGKKKIVLAPITHRKGKNKLLERVRHAGEERRRSSARIKVPEIVEEPSVEVQRPEILENEAYQVQEEPTFEENENPELNNQTTIRRVYKIDKHEIMLGFVTLEVVLTKPNGAPGMSLSTYLGTNDLKKIYLNSDEEMAKIIINSLVYKDGDLKIKIRDNTIPTADPTDDDEAYPTNKTNIPVTLGGQEFEATILYPYLEISIAGLNYKEKQLLKPRYLSNLYDANFENLEDYITRFSLPPQFFKSRAQIIDDELKALPTIVKKVIRKNDFGGLMLFKGLEIHLRNTSDLKPQTRFDQPEQETPRTRHLMKNRKKDVDKVLIRLNFADMQKISRCTADEIVELIKTSTQVEEGAGFKIEFEEEQIAQYVHREEFAAENFPEVSQKFTIRFNKFLYEGFIKFPTLELYIPETNYKNVIQMTPELIHEILGNACNSMEKHLDLFKLPDHQHEEIQEVQVSHNSAEEQNNTPIQEKQLEAQNTEASVEKEDNIMVEEDKKEEQQIQTNQNEEENTQNEGEKEQDNIEVGEQRNEEEKAFTFDAQDVAEGNEQTDAQQ